MEPSHEKRFTLLQHRFRRHIAKLFRLVHRRISYDKFARPRALFRLSRFDRKKFACGHPCQTGINRVVALNGGSIANREHHQHSVAFTASTNDNARERHRHVYNGYKSLVDRRLRDQSPPEHESKRGANSKGQSVRWVGDGHGGSSYAVTK